MPIYDEHIDKVTDKELSIEWLKMKLNPLYFITNYVYTDVAGGKVLLSFDSLLPKHIAFIKSAFRLNDVILFASRRTYKTTLTSAYILWSALFYPRFKTLIVFYEKQTGKELLEKIKFMYNSLPKWIRKIVPRASKGEKVTYVDFANGSLIFMLTPSAQRPASRIGRGLNLSGIYIDEAAFLPLDELFTSLAPAYRSAKQQAAKNGYPYYLIISTTPNGRLSYPGRIFYEYYTHAIPIEELYDFSKNDWKTDNPKKLRDEIMKSSQFYNNFTKIKIHYSELPDTSWVEEEKRRLRYYTSIEGKRKWNQEYELLFLGSKDNIFSDDTIQEMEPIPPKHNIDLGQNIQLKLWIDKFEENNWYIFGIDTAKSIDGDYSAIEIFDLKTFTQVGELKHRFGSVKLFTDYIIKMIFYLAREHKLKANFTLAIENVGIGNTTIEFLLDYPDYDFSQHMLTTELKSKKTITYGIPTNSSLKLEMINILYQYITENPKRIKSYELIEELQLIERRNNKISAPPGYHDDLFMATAFSAYARYQLLKNPRYLTPELLEELDEHYKAQIKQMEKTLDIFTNLQISEDSKNNDKDTNFMILSNVNSRRELLEMLYEEDETNEEDNLDIYNLIEF